MTARKLLRPHVRAPNEVVPKYELPALWLAPDFGNEVDIESSLIASLP